MKLLAGSRDMVRQEGHLHRRPAEILAAFHEIDHVRSWREICNDAETEAKASSSAEARLRYDRDAAIHTLMVNRKETT